MPLGRRNLLRHVPLVRTECVRERHLEPELAQRVHERQEHLALVLGVRGRVIGELGDANGVVLGVPGSGAAKRLELRRREVISAGA